MKKWRAGFTIIEVTLFLAITGLLFMGIVAGTQNSINKQRAYDSVQSFAEFLRSVYSGVTNPQSQLVGGGKSDKALYGKMITFGESKNLIGEDNRRQIFVYDVIGDIDPKNINRQDVQEAFANLDLNVFAEKNNSTWEFAGIPESYTPRWQAVIEDTNKLNRTEFKGTVLIVKHPRSGTVSTFVATGANGVVQVNESGPGGHEVVSKNIKNLLINDSPNDFKQVKIDFCINPFDDDNLNNRVDVRIIEGAHNASGVEIMDLNSSQNSCRQSVPI